MAFVLALWVAYGPHGIDVTFGADGNQYANGGQKAVIILIQSLIGGGGAFALATAVLMWIKSRKAVLCAASALAAVGIMAAVGFAIFGT